MARDWQPSITIDPGPYEAARVTLEGRRITVLGGPRRPEEKGGGEEKPIKIPQPTKPPIVAELAVSVMDALAREPSQAAGHEVEIAPGHMPYGSEEGIQDETEAVPSANDLTIVYTLEGTNAIDLDAHGDLFDRARSARAEILIRFT